MTDRKTYFIDIDGTLVHHHNNFETSLDSACELLVLAGAKEKTIKWHCEGHMIILTTARPGSTRELTERQLNLAGIVYNRLIMDLGAGPRILINDYVGAKNLKAIAYNVARNIDGLSQIP